MSQLGDRRRDTWRRLCNRLTKGYAHPRLNPLGTTWQNPEPRLLLETTLSIADAELPACWRGSQYEPADYDGLGLAIRRIFDALDRAEGDHISRDELAERARTAANLVEPFLVKLLARVAPDRIDPTRNARGLVGLLATLEELGLSPFPDDAPSDSAAFRRADGGEKWSALTWCMWQVLGERHADSHRAPDYDLPRSLAALWSCTLVLLAIAERVLPKIDVAAGRLPPRFKAVRKLGEGGMGVVYEAIDLNTGVRRAIKVVRVSEGGSAIAASILRREAETLEKLNSPRVVRYFGMQPHGDSVAIEMALVEGESLQSELDSVGPMSVANAIATTIDILSALEYVHGENIVHHDVKPGNFVRTLNGIVVIDFGLARASGVDHTRSRRLGSDRFMAPEQIEGRGDHRSDLFGVARTLYTLLAGRPPSHDADPLTMARAGGTDISGPLAAVYRKATSREPQDRYHSALEMRQALERARDGSTISPTEDTLGPGHVWSDLFLEQELATSAPAHWKLFRARAPHRPLSRYKQLWIHQSPTREEREMLARVAVKLFDSEPTVVQRLDEFIEYPVGTENADVGMVFEEISNVTLASVLVKCAQSGRRFSPNAAGFVFSRLLTGLSRLAVSVAELRAELGTSESNGDASIIGRRALRVWPRAVRFTAAADVKLSAIEMFREGQRSDDARPDPCLRYVAPEEVDGPVPAADPVPSLVYSAALMTWESLVGSQAFPARDREELVASIRGANIPSLSSRNVHTDPRLEAALMTALSPSPETRPDFTSLLDAIPDSAQAHGRRDLERLLGTVTPDTTSGQSR